MQLKDVKGGVRKYFTTFSCVGVWLRKYFRSSFPHFCSIEQFTSAPQNPLVPCKFGNTPRILPYTHKISQKNTPFCPFLHFIFYQKQKSGVFGDVFSSLSLLPLCRCGIGKLNEISVYHKSAAVWPCGSGGSAQITHRTLISFSLPIPHRQSGKKESDENTSRKTPDFCFW